MQQPKVSVSADVAGRVISVAVHDNQQVDAGDVLFTIDPEPYRIALDQAEAALASARVNVEQLRVAYGTANAQLDAAKATLAIRQKPSSTARRACSSRASPPTPRSTTSRLALQPAQSNVALAQQERGQRHGGARRRPGDRDRRPPGRARRHRGA